MGPTDIASLLNKKYPVGKDQHDFMYNNMIPTMQKILGEIRDLVTTSANRTILETYTMHPTTNPLTSSQFNWQDFYKYISLNGLQETSSFINDFPFPSDKYSLYKQYIDAGNIELDR